MISRMIQIAMAILIGLPTFAAAAGIVQLPATGQTSCFNANGGVIACTGTGQDGDTRANGVAWPTPRFTDNLNGAMTDNLTGLIWTKHANAPELALGLGFCTPATPGPQVDMTWPQSMDYINCLNGLNTGVGYLGFNDWRLPNVNELESMVNAQVADTAISFLTPAGFIQAQSSQYWTSTTDASNLPASPFATLNAWDMDLAKGQSFSSDKTLAAGTKAVWPVRGVSTGPAKIWRTGQDVCFDLAGDLIACAGTGQDGEKLAGAVWPAIRFKTSLDNTFVLDRVTGLIWTKNTNTPGPLGGVCAGTGLPAGLSWLDALTHAACLNTNSFLGLQPNPVVGNTGWRIPNRKELRSLVDYSRGGPALPALHPFTDTLGLTYWSSTTDAFVPIQAWSVSMLDGTLSGSNKTGTFPAWPVSGPDLVPPALAITQGNMTTNVAIQTISGTVEAGATVTVVNNGGAPATATVTGATWSFTFNPLTVGANNITVSAADFSENISTTAPISITLDTVAPALTMTPVTTPTNVASQTISGTVDVGATVVVKRGPTVLPVTVNGSAWSATVSGLVAGANTITVTATDAAGNISALPAATITLDTIPSVTTATPLPGVFADRVTVALATTEPGSTIHYTIDGTPVTNASPAYNGPFTLTAAIANQKVQFFSVDTAGNVEVTKSADYTMQDSALTGSVNINNGALQTSSAGVTLTLAASDPTGVPQMQVACDGATFAAVEPFAATRNCALLSGDGTKVVAVKFIDGIGIVSSPFTATIILDTTLPSASVTPIAGNYSGAVAVTLTATEAGSTIYYTTDGTAVTTTSVVYSAPISLTPTATSTITVRFMAVDKAGNAGPVNNAAYTVLVGAGSVGIKINNDAFYTTNATVTLTLSAFGVSDMQFSNDGVNYSTLETYAASKAWALSSGDGLKTVYVRFKDGTGSLSTTSATITFAATAATVSSSDLNGDNQIDISDALKALQISIGLLSPTMDEKIRGDVAPLVNGKPMPDGVIDLSDALIILRRVVGLVAPW